LTGAWRQSACQLGPDLRSCETKLPDRQVQGVLVADKSPKKSSSKKPGKSLKEKRAEKQAKKNEKRPSGL
jgi:hypothetical protein